MIGKWSVGGPSLPNSLNINNTGLSTGHAGGGAQTFTFNYRDISGAANIGSGQVEFIDSTPAGNARCNFQWQRPNILNVYTTGASTNTLGTTISDGFCTVSLTSITNSPTDPSVVAVTVSIAFQQDYPGVYGTQTYGVQTQITDTNGFQTSWGQLGTWTVDQSPIGPYSGSGASQTFTVSAADPNGQAYTSITNVQVIFNWSASTVDACFLSYDTVSDKLYLGDKTGNFSVFPPLSLKSPGGTLGSIAQNTSNCQIDGSSSSVTGSGSSLYLNLKTTFNTTFIGQQNTYVLVSDNLSNGQAVLQGSWTAFPAPSANPPTSILPSGINTDGTHTMTFTFDDPNGFSYVPGMYVQIGQTFEDPGNCRFLYWRGTGALNHTVNVYSDSWGSYLGQAPVGQPGAIISSTNRCAVNIGASFFGENGTRGALNAVIDIKNASPNGQITVWTLPFDRQIAHTPLWAASTFSIAAADFRLDPISTINIQQTSTPTVTGFQIPVSVFGNFAGTVSFTCTPPTGATVACSGPIGTGPGANLASFSVTPSSGAVSGTITITGTSGSLSHSLVVPLTISAAPPPPSVSFSGNQTQTTTPGGSVIFAMTVTGNNGWNQPVTILAANAYVDYDICVYTTTICTGSAYSTSSVSVTPPATVYFKATDHTYHAATAYLPATPYPQTALFIPGATLPGKTTTGISGTKFTLITQQGPVPPDYILTVPTQITVPVGGTVTSTVSIVQQGSYVGTQTLSSSTGISSFSQSTLALSTSIATASTTIIFSGASRTAGIHTEAICAGTKCQSVQVTVTPAITTLPQPKCKSSGAVFGFAANMYLNQDGTVFGEGQAKMLNPSETGWNNTVSNVNVSIGNNIVVENQASDTSKEATAAIIDTPAFTNQLGYATYKVSVDHTHSNNNCTITLEATDTGVLSADLHTVTYSGDSNYYNVPDSTLPLITSVTLNAPLSPGGATTGSINGLHFGTSRGNGTVSVCSPGSDPCASTVDLTTPTINSWACSKDSCQITFSIQASQTAIGNYDLQVASGGTNSSGLLGTGGGQQKTSSNRGTIQVSARPAVQISLNDLNGNSSIVSAGDCTKTSAGSFVYISPDPNMPQLNARLVPQSGQALAGTVAWRINISFNRKISGGSVTDSDDFPTSGVHIQNAGDTWYIVQDFPYQVIRGGLATVSWTYASNPTQHQTFCIAGTNPDNSAAKTFLVATPADYTWFIQQLAKTESIDVTARNVFYNQFKSDFTPLFGPPGGYGMMQLDPPPGPQEVWDWRANINGGKNVVVSKRDAATSGATDFWNRQVQQFNDWNTNHTSNPVLAPDDDPQFAQFLSIGNCTFTSKASNLSADVHPLRDAILIKMYNSAPQNYVSWDNVNGQWQFSNLNGQNFDYVSRVCSTTP